MALSPCKSRDFIIQITYCQLRTIVIVLYLTIPLALALLLAHSNSTIDNDVIICYMEKEPRLWVVIMFC